MLCPPTKHVIYIALVDAARFEHPRVIRWFKAITSMEVIALETESNLIRKFQEVCLVRVSAIYCSTQNEMYGNNAEKKSHFMIVLIIIILIPKFLTTVK